MIQRQGQRQKQKMSTRAIVAVAASSILAIIAVLFFVFHIGNPFKSRAASNDIQVYVVTKTINDSGKNYMDVYIYAKTIGQAYNLGTSSFVLNYDPRVLTYSALDHTGSKFSSVSYIPILSARYGTSARSIETNLRSTPGTLISSTDSGSLVGKMRFEILNIYGNPKLTWAKYSALYKDDDKTLLNVTWVNPPSAPIKRPITLINLNAEMQANEVSLNWTTNTEYNSTVFSIQRSKDQTNFDQVMNKTASINSNNTVNYSDVDAQPLTGTSYYRVLLSNSDGTIDTSNIVSITNNTSTSGINPDAATPGTFAITSISPTTFTQSTSINYTMPKAGNARMVVTNTGGKTIMEIQLPSEEGENTYRLLNAGVWEPGLYIVNMYFEGQTTFGKMVKQ